MLVRRHLRGFSGIARLVDTGVSLKQIELNGEVRALAVAWRQAAIATTADKVLLLQPHAAVAPLGKPHQRTLLKGASSRELYEEETLSSPIPSPGGTRSLSDRAASECPWLPHAEVVCAPQGDCELVWLASDLLAAFSRGGGMCLFTANWAAQKIEALQDSPYLPSATVEGVALSPSSSSLAVACEHAQPGLDATSSGSHLSSSPLPRSESGIYHICMLFSLVRAALLLRVAGGGRIAVLPLPLVADMRERVLDLRPTPRREPIVAVAWSPHGDFLTAATLDGGQRITETDG